MLFPLSRMASRSMRSPSCGEGTAAHWRLRRKLALLPGKWGQDGAVLLFSEDDPFRVLAGQRGVMYRRPGLLPSDLPGARPPPDHGQGVQHASPGGPDWPCPAPGQRWKPRRRRRPQCMPLPVPPPPRRRWAPGPDASATAPPELAVIRRVAAGLGRFPPFFLILSLGSSLPWLSHGLPPSTLDRPGPPRSRP